MPKGKRNGVRWLPLLGGFVVLYAVLQGAAATLNSTLGEAGLAVGAITLGAALIVRRVLFTPSWRESWRTLGLDAPSRRVIIVTVVLSALMLAGAALYLNATGLSGLRHNAIWLSAGILAQAGLAEEVVFRGFLYGHLRRRYRFWRAALLSMLPFAAVHLTMFATMDWPIAAAALAFSIAVSFPFAKLYDLGGGTIWGPVVTHAIIQGVPKLVLGADALFPVVWMAMVIVIMSLAFLVKPSSDNRS